MNDYLIIGNSAAATGAIEGIRTVDKKGDIAVLSEEVHLCYSRPLISYFLAGKVDGGKIIYRGRDFYSNNKVNLHLGSRAIEVDPDKKVVTSEEGREYPYQKLLISTGSSPLVHPFKGSGKKGQHFFYNLNDVYHLKENIKEGDSAVVVGGGLIGLKAAEALSLKGLKVTVVEKAPYLLSSILNQVSATILEERIRKSGIRVIVNNTVEEITGTKKVEGVILGSGERISCTTLVLAVGVKPNISFMENSGIPVNRGIPVNEKMETQREGVYAAGDVVEGWDPLSENKRVVPIWPAAYCQGLVAGKNMAGHPMESSGEFPRNSISFFGLNIITAGLLEVNSGEEEIINYNEDKNTYYRVLIKDNRLVGMIKMGDIKEAGVLTWMIKKKMPANNLMERLKSGSLNPVHLPESIRSILYGEEGVK